MRARVRGNCWSSRKSWGVGGSPAGLDHVSTSFGEKHKRLLPLAEVSDSAASNLPHSSQRLVQRRHLARVRVEVQKTVQSRRLSHRT